MPMKERVGFERAAHILHLFLPNTFLKTLVDKVKAIIKLQEHEL